MLQRLPPLEQLPRALEALARSDPRELAASIEALRPAGDDPQAPAGIHWMLSRYVEHALASARSIEAADALFRLACSEIEPSRILEMRRAFDTATRRRWVAALLASSQTPEVALELLERNE